ncbi:MAG: Purine nucleoside phosphorylase 1 [Alphaproteobacteria bacterium MarineAlpha5_Bin8]|nr:MAG: Purine nucleoside phosphorylase 1 [Alphaproteobacteria bacterium MarineAlpha5_Bin7]PPR47268.1 MAG: Purine nucleoside phosphorylase 1 [Alphaproteobacteria bacterium MarineAlpha5_Bin8]PPR54594.1 MAG: Purine nucleoside phosphorylase 1 [Alphaproteobacteria bacterium MarineAlpha5_Bin6]|tara:strand:- start:1147 stop:1977 length:831 start_codon:yes stop_codon:yes gene_type:complete
MHNSAEVFLKKSNNIKPDIAVILGSGLTNFFEEKNIISSISYKDLPDFPQPTVKGHTGKLVLGKIGKINVVCMYGRSHIYEGHDPQSLAAPIRVIKDIGCKLLIITNAAGSLDQNMPAGSLMVIKDHINWSGFNPLIGPNADSYGPRFHDMSDGYNKNYRKQLLEVANKIDQKLYEGVYCMYSGPNFETPAEINALKVIGGKAVGMSTVPEVLVANHCGLSVIGISVITNLAAGMNKTKLSHQETLENAALAENNIINLIKNFINDIQLDDSSGNN